MRHRFEEHDPRHDRDEPGGSGTPGYAIAFVVAVLVILAAAIAIL